MVFNGVANQFYSTRLPRREDCLSHETYPEPVELPLANRSTVAELFEAARPHVEGPLELALDRELVVAIDCPRCGWRGEVMRPRIKVRAGRGRLPELPRAGAARSSPAPSRNPRRWPTSRFAASASRLTISCGSTARPARGSSCWPPTATTGHGRDRRGDGAGGREPVNGDDIVFGEMKVREPERLPRPDRDRKYACLAYEVPAPDRPADLPRPPDRRRHRAPRPERHLRRAGRHPAGQGVRRPGHRPAVRLGHPVARGQALRQHPGELHLHPRLLGGDHPRARPAPPRLRHRRLVSHASQLRDLPLAPRPVHPPAFLRPAAPGGLRRRPDQPDPRLLPVARRRPGAGRRLLPDRRSRRPGRAGPAGQRPGETPQSRRRRGRVALPPPRGGADQDAHPTRAVARRLPPPSGSSSPRSSACSARSSASWPSRWPSGSTSSRGGSRSRTRSSWPWPARSSSSATTSAWRPTPCSARSAPTSPRISSAQYNKAAKDRDEAVRQLDVQRSITEDDRRGQASRRLAEQAPGRREGPRPVQGRRQGSARAPQAGRRPRGDQRQQAAPARRAGALSRSPRKARWPSTTSCATSAAPDTSPTPAGASARLLAAGLIAAFFFYKPLLHDDARRTPSPRTASGRRTGSSERLADRPGSPDGEAPMTSRFVWKIGSASADPESGISNRTDDTRVRSACIEAEVRPAPSSGCCAASWSRPC